MDLTRVDIVSGALGLLKSQVLFLIKLDNIRSRAKGAELDLCKSETAGTKRARVNIVIGFTY